MLKRVQYSTGAVLPDGQEAPYLNPSANDALSIDSLEQIAVVFVADDLQTAVQLAAGETVRWDAKLPDALDAAAPVLSAELSPLYVGSPVWAATIDTSVATATGALDGATDPVTLSGQFSRYPVSGPTPFRSERFPLSLDNVVRQPGDMSAVSVLTTADIGPDPGDLVVRDANGNVPGAGVAVGTTPGTVAAGDDPRIVNASRDYVGENYQAFATRIAGKTANAATVNLFSAGDFTAGTGFQWNPTRWCATVDLTCLAVWNSRGGAQRGGVAITAKHVALANHFPLAAGDFIKFVGADNMLYSRTITGNPVQIGASDVMIATLDSDLPAAIKPAKLLPTALGSFAGFLPLLNLNQARQAHIKQAAVADAVASLASNTATIWTAQTALAPFDAWTTGAPVGGDSGSGNGFIIGSEFYLAFLDHAVDADGNLVGDWIGAQLPAINTVLGSGYALSVPAFTTTHDPAAFHSGDAADFSDLSADVLRWGVGPIIEDDADPQPLVLPYTDAQGKLCLLSPSPGQSIRLKADGSGFEAYTPSVGGANLGPSARFVPITNGVKLQVSADNGTTWQDGQSFVAT